MFTFRQIRLLRILIPSTPSYVVYGSPSASPLRASGYPSPTGPPFPPAILDLPSSDLILRDNDAAVKRS